MYILVVCQCLPDSSSKRWGLINWLPIKASSQRHAATARALLLLGGDMIALLAWPNATLDVVGRCFSEEHRARSMPCHRLRRAKTGTRA